jgi:4-hydroxy-tetrahydrodipicolinate synthase
VKLLIHGKTQSQLSIYILPPSLVLSFSHKSERGLIRHFTQVADMGLPVVLYNVPGRTASVIQDDTLAILADHDNIVGIKDATGDVSRLQSAKLAIGRDKEFLFYSGDDSTTRDFVLLGGDGCISVTATVVPHMMHEMVHAALDGNAARANELNDRLALLHKNLFIESNPIAAKWAAKRIGLIDSDFCRPPLDRMDEQYAPAVDAALQKAGFLGVSRLWTKKIQTHHDESLPIEERVNNFL